LDNKKIKINLFNLDILRTVAVTLVVISHLPNLELPTYYEQRGLGLLGVVLFFVHTSFVLMSSLERIDSKNFINYKFYIQRIFRIYPLSIFAVCLYSYIVFVIDYKFDLNSFFSNIFLIQNFTQGQSNPKVLWSLPYEVQMYFFYLLFLCS
jgi:peptidoglycan/LPS O-acetylase OafA/YrhL